MSLDPARMSACATGISQTCKTVILVLLAALPLAAAVPTPKSHFGHEIGVDRTLLDWDKVVSYFQALPKASNRIRVAEIGKSVEGRPFIAATIADPDTLAHLDRYIAIQQKLADPRQTSDAEAEKLILQGKAIVLITCSIHATEVASTHTAVEFVYRLLTEDKPRYRAILRDTIFLLVPSLNPDGVDIVTRWYRKTLGTKFEGTAPPELYHHYTGHDNNRDWYIFSQPETRATIGKLHNVWHPQIVYDVHQQGAYGSRIFIPPWLDPTEPNIDAILMQETNMIGTAMAADLTGAGKVGIAIHASYDFWTPSRHYQAFHGGMRLLTESASARLASPIEVGKDEIEESLLGYRPRERSWNYLEPWLGGTWRLRDIIDYQLLAWESCLYNAALHREDLLRNFYRVGKRQVARTSPSAFVISSDQRDPGATRRLVDTLRFGMVEVRNGPGGSAVVPMQQPYAGWAKALLERQQYPNDLLYPGGPPKRPYDVTAHTLPLLMGVKVDAVEKQVEASGTWQARAVAAGPKLSITDTDTWTAVNQAWKAGKTVWRNPATGDFALADPGAGWKQIARPRVALFQAWNPSMDEGWTRWMLDQFGFAYTSVRPKDLQSADLRGRFDVIVFPDQSGAIIDAGYRPGSMPDEYTGGLGAPGADALKKFAQNGGTVVFLNGSTEYAVDKLGVAATNTTGRAGRRGGSSSDYYSPGSLLNVKLQAGHPLTYGMPEEITIWSEHSPAWDTNLPVVARYPSSGILASGWLLGEKVLANRAALVDAPMGRGHVVLFGMRPQYRAQSYLTLKMFFNSLLYY
jgi:hypothetical protein